MLTQVDHVTIVVADVRAATAAYARVLGAAPVWQGSHPELGTGAALFALKNSLVELMGPDGGNPAGHETEALRAHLEAGGEGLHTLSFATADAAACSKLLRERGVRATPPQDGEARASDGSLRSYRLVELSPRATRALPISVVERSAPVASFQPRPASAGAVDALDHVLITTSDIEQAVVLYGDQLGLRLALDRVVGERRMLFFRVGGVTLEILHAPEQTESDKLAGLAYRVADLQAAHARLLAEGLDVSEPREGKKPGTRVFTLRASATHGVPTLFLRDPGRD